MSLKDRLASKHFYITNYLWCIDDSTVCPNIGVWGKTQNPYLMTPIESYLIFKVHIYKRIRTAQTRRI